MKKVVFFIMVALLLVNSNLSAQGTINKDYYIALLNQGNYQKAYTELCALQKKPYGKCCLSDFLIAKSLCLSGLYPQANNRFKKMLANYKLPKKTVDYLQTEKSSCSPSATVASLQTSHNITIFPLPTSSVRGKLGKVFNCYQSYEPTHIVTAIPEEELNDRLFSQNESAKALAKIKTILPEGYQVEVNGRFILVNPTTSELKAEDKNKVVNELNRAVAFYVSNYHLSEPDKLLTVYIVPNNEALKIVALKVHGIEIPKENYGYSSLSDLSLAGVSNAIGVGTLKHELFHLMVRANIGDIPPWLDEGIATLYEESEWKNGILMGKDKFWRNEVLEETLSEFHLYTKLPDLETLINYSWNEFEGVANGDICKASVNYALAKHFAVYLQEQRMLPQLIQAFRDKEPDDMNEIIPSNSDIVQKAMGKRMRDIETDFNQWLKIKYRLDISKPDTHVYEVKDFIKLKNNLREAGRLLNELKEHNTPSSDLEIQLQQSEKMFEAATDLLDLKMKQLYLSTGNNKQTNDEALLQVYKDFGQSIQDIDKQLMLEVNKH